MIERAAQHFTWRRNGIMVVSLALCFYFSYHLLQGERSAGRLLGLKTAITRDTVALSELRQEHEEMERRVTMLRPGSINRDFLEERARIMLGYRAPGELDVVPGKSQKLESKN